ncbi:MAG: HDOD domain-containing protein [Pirellulaceae bacterium]
MSEILIARQPIFDRDSTVIGYELLYRGNETDRAVFSDGNLATSRVLSRAFMDVGVDNLIGDKLAFVNLPKEFIVGDLDLPIQESQLVLEVLEDVELDDEVIQSLELRRNEGYQLAVDDVVAVADVERALPLVHIVKIDLMSVDREKLPGEIQELKKYPVKLLAEKVETQDELNWCRDLGFDYFQGYFLCKPTIVREKKLSSSAITIMQVLALISSPDSEIEEVEHLVVKDVTLSFKILRLINSAAFGLNNEIKSLKQALSILGSRKLRALLGFMMLDQSDNKPIELMVTATVRAKMCEEILLRSDAPDAASGFTVGFFSILDALLDVPLETLMEQLPLSLEIKDAIVHRKGRLGELLEHVIAYERGDWGNATFDNISNDAIQECYLSALRQAAETSKLVDEQAN